MTTQPEPCDFSPCPHCGQPRLHVGIWDDVVGKVGDQYLIPEFTYAFAKRDYKERLVVFEAEAAEPNRHELFCTKAPPPEPPHEFKSNRKREKGPW